MTKPRARTPETPQTMQKRLRAALRSTRLEVGLKQAQVAAKLEWSTSKIIRIEQGATRVSVTDLKALMDLYDVSDAERRDEWLAWARGARRPQQWSEYKEFYSDASLELFGTEEAARAVYQFEPTFIPGLLQTEDYARALLAALGKSGREIDKKVKVRIERQEMFDREDRPTFTFIIGEAAVTRRVGSNAVMRGQISKLIEMSNIPSVSIRVLPFSAGPHRRMGGSFTSMLFGDPELDAVYLETPTGEKLLRENPEEISDYNSDFSNLESKSIPESDLKEFLGEIMRTRFRDK